VIVFYPKCYKLYTIYGCIYIGIFLTAGQKSFSGIEIKTMANSETVMTGEIIDQTALHTLIQRIRDIGLTLIEVKRLDDIQEK